jgi:hypothetical protein
MIEPLSLGSQADRNIAQAFSVRELCEDHAQKLVPAGKSSCAMIAFVSSHALPELVHGKIVEQLSKDGPSLVHANPSKGAQHAIAQNSNRFSYFDVQELNIQRIAAMPTNLTGH